MVASDVLRQSRRAHLLLIELPSLRLIVVMEFVFLLFIVAWCDPVPNRRPCAGSFAVSTCAPTPRPPPPPSLTPGSTSISSWLLIFPPSLSSGSTSISPCSPILWIFSYLYQVVNMSRLSPPSRRGTPHKRVYRRTCTPIACSRLSLHAVNPTKYQVSGRIQAHSLQVVSTTAAVEECTAKQTRNIGLYSSTGSGVVLTRSTKNVIFLCICL